MSSLVSPIEFNELNKMGLVSWSRLIYLYRLSTVSQTFPTEGSLCKTIATELLRNFNFVY